MLPFFMDVSYDYKMRMTPMPRSCKRSRLLGKKRPIILDAIYRTESLKSRRPPDQALTRYAGILSARPTNDRELSRFQAGRALVA